MQAFKFYRCPRCRSDQAVLLQTTSYPFLWLCSCCMRLYWLVKNLLGEEVFIEHNHKTIYFDANDCKRPKPEKPPQNDDDCPF